MPRNRALVRSAVAIVLFAVVFAAAWSWFQLEPLAPMRGTSEPSSPVAHDRAEPSLPSATTASQAGAEPRVTVADPELAEELARRRLYESFGARRVGATPGDLRVAVVAGETKVVAREAFLVEIRTTYGEEQAWLEIVRRLRPVEATSRTDVDGIARFQGQHLHGALVWVMNGQTMVWRATGPIYWKPVHTELALGPVTLRGTVHDAAGVALAGAVICAALPPKKVGNQEEASTSYVGVSDELGTFELTGLPNGMLTVTCHWPGGTRAPAGGSTGEHGGREKRVADASRTDAVRVRFGATPGARTWRGRVVDENGVVVVGPNEIRLEHEHGERRLAVTQSDGTFAVPLLPGAWRARAGAEAASARPFELTIGRDDVVHDVVLAGRQVLLRLAGADASVELDEALQWLSLSRDVPATGRGLRIETLHEALQKATGGAPGDAPRQRGVPMAGGRRFSWNGAEWYGWSGLPPGHYHVGIWGSYEIVGMPEGGLPIDTELASPTIADVLFRRVQEK